MTTNRKLLEVVAVLAAYPLEEFAIEHRADDTPLFKANDWKLLVGHVRRAREALEEEKKSWVENKEGSCPCGDATPVEVLLRSGESGVDLAGEFCWWIDDKHPTGGDIIRYRVCP